MVDRALACKLADEIRFIPVADASTRVEGLLSGQFDFADGLPTEAIDRIEQSDKAEPVVTAAFWLADFGFQPQGRVIGQSGCAAGGTSGYFS